MSYTEQQAGGPGLSEKETELIGEETRRLVAEAREKAVDVLVSSRDALDRAAEALLERETLSKDELEALAAAPAVRANGR